jgi:hypothetical protein
VIHGPEEEPTGGEPPVQDSAATTPAEAGTARYSGGEVVSGLSGLSGPGEPEADHRAFLRELWQRRSAQARTVTAAATVAVLALGGTVAYAATSGSSGSESTAGASGSASPSPDKPDGSERRGGPGGRGMLFGFGFGSDAAHGEATVKDRDTGKWVVRIWQRGAVEKVDGDKVTVKSEDGAAWTWTVGSDATVRKAGASSSGAAKIEKGETIHLVGTAGGSTRTAEYARAGTAEEMSPGDKRGRFPWHGPREGQERGKNSGFSPRQPGSSDPA